MNQSLSIHSFEETLVPAKRLAQQLSVPCHTIQRRRFPDGESLVRVSAASESLAIYCSLNHPNHKLIELMLAASALREGGCKRLFLVAPYLCYMRQDKAFQPGEAISQKVIGAFLGDLFEGLVSVDPHLHRIDKLSQVIPNTKAITLSAAPCLTDRLRARKAPPSTILVGPDSESEPWVRAVAAPLGLDILLGQKVRQGDRDVHIEFPKIERVAGRPALLIDDIVSTGRTLIESAKLLTHAGAEKVEVMTTHMLASDSDLKALYGAGIERLESSDSVLHQTNQIQLAPLLCEALRGLAK